MLSFAPNARITFSPKSGGMAGITAKILLDFGLRAVTASEIEFYLFGSDGCDLSSFWEEVKDSCVQSDIEIFKIEKERGHEQHEVSLKPRNPEKTVRDTIALKTIISELASKHSMQASFAAKPLPDDCGSGLHIHIHLENMQGKNQFLKQDAVISDTLNYSIGGLLLWMPDTMPVFAPNEDSYARFVGGSNSPLTVSWGANNRTTALRLPDSAHDNKRIEHRAAGADADVWQVVYVILAAIHYGLINKIKPDGQVYGDASLDMYSKPKFPANLEIASKRMKQSIFPLRQYGVLIDS